MFYQTTSLDRVGWCSNNTNNLDVNYTQPDDEALEDLMEAHEAYMNSEEEYDEVPEDWNSERTDTIWYRDVNGNVYEDYEQSIGE